ncbi:MAG: membrane protein insertase YidC [Candidatus Niyogibacteria bacterium]|nr:membrane protein insertase YidC [Candidatus Niyogibacteria bacterium]
MAGIFNEVFYRPLLNALVVLTGVLPFHDLGLAVILLTILVRFLMFPFSHRPMVAQHKMKMIEPELQKIRERVKEREAQAKETMALYKRHGINPFAGIVSVIFQIPLFLALYWVFSKSGAIDPQSLYSFVALPDGIHTEFLGIFELTERSIVWAAFAGLSQFIHMKLTNHPTSATGAKSDFGKAFSFQMTYGMPFIIFFVSLSFPAAVSVYWTVSNIFSTVHEGFVRRKLRTQNAHEARDRENPSNDQNPAGTAGMPGVH